MNKIKVAAVTLILMALNIGFVACSQSSGSINQTVGGLADGSLAYYANETNFHNDFCKMIYEIACFKDLSAEDVSFHVNNWNNGYKERHIIVDTGSGGLSKNTELHTIKARFVIGYR